MSVGLYTTTMGQLTAHGLQIMSLPEYKAMTFVLQRTLRYNKLEEKIPLRHFTEGVATRKTGELIISGVQANRGRVSKALRNLEQKGFISVKRSASVNTYRIKPEAIAREINKVVGDKLMPSSKLKTPKKSNKTLDKKAGTIESPQEPKIRDHNVPYKLEKVLNRETTVGGSYEQVLRKIEEIKNISTAAREKRTAKSAGKITASNIRDTWISVCNHNGCAYTLPTEKELHMFKAVFVKQKESSGFTLHSFIELLITRWTTIGRQHMAWLTGSYPAVPDFPFTCRMLKHVLPACVQARDYKSDINNPTLVRDAKAADSQASRQRHAIIASNARAELLQMEKDRQRALRASYARDNKDEIDAKAKELGLADELPEWDDLEAKG